MELPNYSSIWRFRQQLHALWDWPLPVPVSYSAIGVTAVVVAVEFLVLPRVGLAPSAELVWLYLGLPAVIGWLATTQRTPDGRSLAAWTAAHLRWVVRPRARCGLAGRPRHTARTDRQITWMPTGRRG